MPIFTFPSAEQGPTPETTESLSRPDTPLPFGRGASGASGAATPSLAAPTTCTALSSMVSLRTPKARSASVHPTGNGPWEFSSPTPFGEHSNLGGGAFRNITVNHKIR